MSISVRAFVLFLICFTALAQPGIPSCWLARPTCEQHLHLNDSHAGRPHSHDYLLDLSKMQAIQAAPVAVTPAGLLIALLGFARIWLQIVPHLSGGKGWEAALEPPPPRLAFA